MLKSIKFFIISNLIASTLIVGIEASTQFFGLKYLSDYAFFVTIMLWGTAALFYMYPPLGGIGPTTDREDQVTDSMVDRSVVDEIDDERFSENSTFCIRLLLSGLPAFLVCLIA
ncbi:hypothetical protein [Vibrio minamisatsumaniensis]|uniref:hypothetical protein n=1 Tax=Vibrio minamisatsumaniensis TaxID=2910243 RepID=UPI003D22272E